MSQLNGNILKNHQFVKEDLSILSVAAHFSDLICDPYRPLNAMTFSYSFFITVPYCHTTRFQYLDVNPQCQFILENKNIFLLNPC